VRQQESQPAFLGREPRADRALRSVELHGRRRV
jgi:hypothetical protein